MREKKLKKNKKNTYGPQNKMREKKFKKTPSPFFAVLDDGV